MVYLDCAIDLSYEPEARPEADAAREQEEYNGDDEHVPKVQRAGDETLDLQLGGEVPHCIEEQVQGGGAGAEE